MKKLIALAAVAALAACSERADDAAPAAEDTTATAEATTAAMTDDPTGTYTFKGSDGSSGTTVINADGTFVDTDAEGKVTRGTFTRKDGKDCFDEEGDAAEVCWTVGAPNADGSFTATSLDGKTTVTVTRTGDAPAATTAATPAPAAT